MHQDIQARGVIQRLASLRTNLIELVIVAVLLGFGVGLAASSLCAILDGMEIWGVMSGVVLSVAGLLYFFFKVLSPKPRVFTCEGFLHVVETDHSVEVHPAYRYELSEKVSDYLRSAFSKNPALLRAWLNSPVRCFSDQSGTSTALSGNALLNQAVEYFFLHRLSLHLSAYFQEQGVEEAECQKFSRADIPDVLLQNRFLELFSKPMEERDHFSDHDRRGGVRSEPPGKVVMAFGRDGALFDMFDLILPQGSTVSRSAKGVLRIETAIFSLEFKPGMEGFATNTPRHFEGLYMGDRDLCDGAPTLVKSEINVKVKRRALLFRSGWQYYRWLDSFIDEYYEKAEADRFFDAIGWETAITANRIASSGAVPARRNAEPVDRGDA